MNKGKKLTAVVAAAATTAAMVAPAFAADASSFTDIDGSYAKDAITSLVAKGIIHGVDATHFNPTAKITREDFSIILANALGLDVSSAPATPSFSDLPTTHYAYKYVEALHKAGIISGVSATEFGTGANITRQDMAALYVRALGVDVTGKASTLTFADKDQIASYAQDAVGYAVEAGLFHGMDATHFAPTANATREQVALVAAKFLDVKASLATAKLTSATFVDNNTVTLSFDKAVDKLDASDVAVAVKATGAAVNVTGVTLSDDKKTATVKVATLSAGTTYTVKVGDNSVDFTSAATAAVSSVTALNLKQIQVTYSAPVDATSSVVPANYTLDGTALSTNSSNTVALQSDNKTVIITLANALANQTSHTLAVASVNDAQGNVIATSSNDFTAFDGQVPSATGVSVVGPNTLKVNFSAPISNTSNSNYTLDNGSVSASLYGGSVGSINGKDYSVTLNVGAALSNGTHTLEVNGAAGYNGFVTNDQKLTFNYTADTTAPTVTVSNLQLASNASTTATFQFSKPVALDANGKLANAKVFAIYDGVTDYQAVSLVPTSTAKSFWSNGVTYADQFTATFNHALPTGNVTFFVDNVDATNNNAVVKDAWGNVFASTSVTGALSLDTAKPTVSSVTSTNMNTVQVNFSKALDATTAKTNANYVVLNADGSVATSTNGGLDSAGHPIAAPALSADANGVNDIVTLSGLGLAGGNYKLQVSGVNDSAVPTENTIATTTVAFSVTDNTAPYVSSVLYTADQKSLIVNYNKPMDPASITDLSNYAVGSTALNSVTGATITALNSNQQVKITFPVAESFLTNGATLTYGHVKDANGNYAALYQNTKTVTPDGISQSDIVAGSAKAVAEDTITFEVDQPLSSIDSTRMQVKFGDNYVKQAGQAYYVNQKVANGTINGALVTVKLDVTSAEKIYDDASNLPTVILNADAAPGTGTALKNANGNGIAAGQSLAVSPVADGIVASVTGAKTHTSNGTNLDWIDVTFSEAMKDSSVGLNSFSVAGYTVTDVTPVSAGTSNEFHIVLKQATYNDTQLTPTVSLASDVQDASGNVLKAGATVPATVKGF